MLRILFTVLLVLTLIAPCLAESPSKVHQPRLTAQISGTTQGLIAVSPVNERVVWASGRGGTYVVTTNGGQTWRAGVVPGAEELQFRDVQGVSDKVAYLLSIGSNPTDFRIYKTEDGGATWTIQFRNQKPKRFMTASRSGRRSVVLPTVILWKVNSRIFVRPTEQLGSSLPTRCPRLYQEKLHFLPVERA
jgi:photosystem II stability/assembly factor-like uncharacterized protein